MLLETWGWKVARAAAQHGCTEMEFLARGPDYFIRTHGLGRKTFNEVIDLAQQRGIELPGWPRKCS